MRPARLPLLALGCALGLCSSLPAQLLRDAPPPLRSDAWDLALRLEPDQVWRQRVRFDTLERRVGEEPLEWEVEVDLRLRCLVREEGAWSVEGAFTDWKLRVHHGDASCEWHQGRYRTEGWQPASARSQEAVRDLLAAWSDGLRRADLRFRLRPDGRIEDLRGLEPLSDIAAAATEGAASLPENLRSSFGPAGVLRFTAALEASIAVPRPLGAVRIGQEWSCECAAPGAPGEQVLRRRLRVLGPARERRHALLRLVLEPLLLGPAGRPREGTEGRGSLELMVGSGLTYRMDVEIHVLLPDGGSLRQILRASHQD